MFITVECNWLCVMDSKRALLENCKALLPRGVVSDPSLSVFKRLLDNVFNNML